MESGSANIPTLFYSFGDDMKSLNREISNKATQDTFSLLLGHISCNLWTSLAYQSSIEYNNLNGTILDQIYDNLDIENE